MVGFVMEGHICRISSGENFLSCVNDCTGDIMVSLTALAKIFSMDFSAIQR